MILILISSCLIRHSRKIRVHFGILWNCVMILVNRLKSRVGWNTLSQSNDQEHSKSADASVLVSCYLLHYVFVLLDQFRLWGFWLLLVSLSKYEIVVLLNQMDPSRETFFLYLCCSSQFFSKPQHLDITMSPLYCNENML